MQWVYGPYVSQSMRKNIAGEFSAAGEIKFIFRRFFSLESRTERERENVASLPKRQFSSRNNYIIAIKGNNLWHDTQYPNIYVYIFVYGSLCIPLCKESKFPEVPERRIRFSATLIHTFVCICLLIVCWYSSNSSFNCESKHSNNNSNNEAEGMSGVGRRRRRLRCTARWTKRGQTASLWLARRQCAAEKCTTLVVSFGARFYVCLWVYSEF